MDCDTGSGGGRGRGIQTLWRRRGGSTTTEASWGGRIEAGTNAIIRKREKRKNGKKSFLFFFSRFDKWLYAAKEEEDNAKSIPFRESRAKEFQEKLVLVSRQHFEVSPSPSRVKAESFFSCWRSKSFEAREGRRVTLQEKFGECLSFALGAPFTTLLNRRNYCRVS